MSIGWRLVDLISGPQGSAIYHISEIYCQVFSKILIWSTWINRVSNRRRIPTIFVTVRIIFALMQISFTNTFACYIINWRGGCMKAGTRIYWLNFINSILESAPYLNLIERIFCLISLAYFATPTSLRCRPSFYNHMRWSDESVNASFCDAIFGSR